MSPTTPLTPVPRLLLFPQVGDDQPGKGGRAVRRYTLTLLPRVERGAGAGWSKPSRD